MQTTIIVATHKPYWVPDDPMYLPVQMGHAVHPACGYIGDDGLEVGIEDMRKQAKRAA